MKIVAVTACPSGVAHTYMSAEALERSAKARGIEIKVETQGSIGIENKLSMEDIKDADVVILTKDIGLKETERFEGKTIVRLGVSEIVKKSDQIIQKIEAHINSKQ
ncbi:MAG: PTS fructose-like transporter subunit IIB [Marinisporobacter sp.]|jgi:fructose-specific PTS system IIB-like component|nr:PTS fructose-like transporter subunit IIB [Marinisporobacter sp.]